MYAVLETGGKQYRVAAGDTLEIERLDVEAGQPFTFDRVLLVNNEGKVSVGAPVVGPLAGAPRGAARATVRAPARAARRVGAARHGGFPKGSDAVRIGTRSRCR